MLCINLKHALATVAVAVGLLSTAGPASATTQHHESDHESLAACAGVGAGFILMADMGGQFF